jgi:hypothetical protein
MKTLIEMAREATLLDSRDDWSSVPDEYREAINAFAELVRADEREQIAQMFDGALPLVEFAQNEHGGCLMCGFTPRLAVAAIRARSNT